MSDFETRGLYVWTDSPDQHEFWKACGINTLQFCDLGWYRNSYTALDEYLSSMAAQIRCAKNDGFSVNVILYSNIKQWDGPEDFEPSGIGEKFYPRNSDEMKKRLNWLARSVWAMREADGFTFFAGDPGGTSPEMGEADYTDWLRMSELVGEVVRKNAPGAYYNVNPWAINMWDNPTRPCQDVRWWIEETEVTEKISRSDVILRNRYGMEIPSHTYYRAMALRLYDQNNIEPVLFPEADDVACLKASGVPRVWAWPYFLLDEADDGDIGPDGAMREMVQSETRYIYRFVRTAKQIGFDGIIGNWSYLGHKAKALNTYAFGRFTSDPKATPDIVIKEFADNITCDDKSSLSVVQALKFIENSSNWQKKLPEKYSISNFEIGKNDVEEILEDISCVKISERPNSFAIPEAPADYFKKLFDRLLWIKNKNVK